MSESKPVTKIFYIFLLASFSSGFSIICFTDLRAAPVGKILQFKAKAYPYRWQLRTGLLLLLVLLAVLAFIATLKEIHRLNIVLAVLIFLLLIVEISMAGKVLTWRNEQTHIVKQQGDGNTMLQLYGSDKSVTKMMDFVQTAYSCCGVTDYRDWATTNWAVLAQKQNAVPASCCKIPGPGCGDDLDIKDPFENIFVQGCTQLLYFSKTSDHDHGGVGMAVLFLHWCSGAACVILACAVTYTSGLTPTQALAGEEPEKKPEKSAGGKGSAGGRSGAGGKSSAGKSPKKQAKSSDGSKKKTGDELDFEDENKPPKGARNMLIDKSELEDEAETVDTSGP